MATQLDVVNAALIDLGQSNLLTALDDASKNSRIMKARWDMSRRAVLQSRPWGFARKRAQLAADQASPVFGPAYRYKLPGDFIRFVMDQDNVDADYREETGYLTSDDGSPINLIYIWDAPIERFSALGCDALAGHLAWRAALAITGNTTDRDAMATQYRKLLADANLADIYNEEPQQFDADVWLRSRRQTFA